MPGVAPFFTESASVPAGESKLDVNTPFLPCHMGVVKAVSPKRITGAFCPNLQLFKRLFGLVARRQLHRLLVCGPRPQMRRRAPFQRSSWGKWTACSIQRALPNMTLQSVRLLLRLATSSPIPDLRAALSDVLSSVWFQPQQARPFSCGGTRWNILFGVVFCMQSYAEARTQLVLLLAIQLAVSLIQNPPGLLLPQWLDQEVPANHYRTKPASSVGHPSSRYGQLSAGAWSSARTFPSGHLVTLPSHPSVLAPMVDDRGNLPKFHPQRI